MRSSDQRLVKCLLLLTSVISSTCGQCSTKSTHSPEPHCIDVFKLLQKALFNNTYNPFQLQSVFYPSSHITPALVRVHFTLMNQTAGSTEPLFNYTLSNPCTFAWTFRSLYQSFHPAVLNQLQFQLPFVLMRLTAGSLTDEPDLDAFLWDGASKLPTVLLNLTIIEPNSLSDEMQSYLQDKKTVKNALGEVTKWVSSYTSQY